MWPTLKSPFKGHLRTNSPLGIHHPGKSQATYFRGLGESLQGDIDVNRVTGSLPGAVTSRASVGKAALQLTLHFGLFYLAPATRGSLSVQSQLPGGRTIAEDGGVHGAVKA